MTYGELHIAHPELIHGLWVWLLVVAALVLLELRGRDRLGRLVGPALEASLVERPASWRRGLRLGLLALSGLLMVVALMRPQWGEQIVATPRVGAEIMIALDVSRSMLADDARPSRLERAKAELSDLLAYLENDQVGLIAFAGRASILAPLTPDKSFLRLALDGAGPHSVSRGGTRLAEPILRAIAGLGRPGPAQRALLLITDGEDHDSFALDAAKRAAAAGIKIITIGFGDEGGSEIHIRNPEDGSRTLVRDGDGNPVVSRLNGELLREIALATDGAYVPAGTGVLDLASIYETHIARLTKGQLDARGRTIRGELHPIFVGAALVCLVAAVSATAGRQRSEGLRSASSPARSSATLALFFACILGATLVLAPIAPRTGRAADLEAEPPGIDAGAGSAAPTPTPAPAPPTTPAPAIPAAGTVTPGAAEAESAPPEPAVLDPRARFNQANERLAAGEFDEASALYREARRDATDDVELRYAASYNLGMAAVARADRLEATKPQDALASLHEAADWFREAAAMRPDEDDPRHNLDVALRRALILADEIARKSRRDIEGELDQLIESQRGRVAESAILLEAAVRAGELAAADTLRDAFDAAATATRELSADAEGLAERVADEKAIAEAKPEAERKPEDALRAASLEGVLAYLDQGIERMGQTRRQLRQRSAERAYRRGAEALDLLKRARDQLRDPVEQLGVLVGEVGEVARAASALAAGGIAGEAAAGGGDGSAGNGKSGASGGTSLPAFLTPESVGAETAAVAARVDELAGRFEVAAERSVQSAKAGTAGAGGAPGSAAPG
ncbi:VWA domain-containing protein, partial [Myxococcota bacterium]|nr:VWA domain-containing protein [Myxococcota bacterium]